MAIKQSGFCEQCGAPLEAGSRFCDLCGTPMSPEVEPAPPSPLRPSALSRPFRPPPLPPPPPPQSPVQAQKTGSSSLWKVVFVISGLGLVALCGLLAIVLGFRWFSFAPASSAPTVTNPPAPSASQTIAGRTPIPATHIPATLIPATLIPATLIPATLPPPKVTPTAQATPTEPVVTEEQAGARDLKGFSDDFSSSINTWKIVSDESNGTVVIINGKLNLQVTKPDKYLSVQVPWYITTPVTDVTLAVTATVETPGLGAFGLFCRASDSKNFYMISIQPNPAGGGQYRFYKDKAGIISYLTDWKDTSLLYGGEVPEEVVFSCKGSTLRLELNREFVDEVTDSDLKSGGAHLFAVSLEDVTESNPYKITFDDFKATFP